MVITVDRVLTERIATAVSRLMKVTPDGERARLSIPVLYPSGTSAAVEIIANGGQCFVSDIGLGQMEAELFGAGNFYSKAARSAAEKFGVGYDDLSIFAVWASIDRLEAAVSAVSSASILATSRAVYSAIEEKDRKKNEELFERVVGLFGVNDVSKEEELKGKNDVWDAHNVVTLRDKRKAVFEYVTEHQSSVSANYTKFSDLSKSYHKYSLTSVVKSIDRLGGKASMLADVSEVIQFSSDDLVYRKRAT